MADGIAHTNCHDDRLHEDRTEHEEGVGVELGCLQSGRRMSKRGATSGWSRAAVKLVGDAGVPSFGMGLGVGKEGIPILAGSMVSMGSRVFPRCRPLVGATHRACGPEPRPWMRRGQKYIGVSVQCVVCEFGLVACAWERDHKLGSEHEELLKPGPFLPALSTMAGSRMLRAASDQDISTYELGLIIACVVTVVAHAVFTFRLLFRGGSAQVRASLAAWAAYIAESTRGCARDLGRLGEVTAAKKQGNLRSGVSLRKLTEMLRRSWTGTEKVSRALSLTPAPVLAPQLAPALRLSLRPHKHIHTHTHTRMHT